MAEDYKQLYESRDDYDVIIYAGEEPNSEEIHAHSLVLRTRSAYFRGALSSRWAIKDKDNGCFIFKKPNISPSVFELILKFLYCGEIDIKDQEGEAILELLFASDEFGLTKLIDHVQQYFVENHQDFLRQDPAKMLHVVARHEALDEIRKYSLETIGSKPEIIFDFYHKVLPYMSILPSNLFNDILRCYMVPGAVPLYNAHPSRSKIDSILINKSHALYFAGWIDKQNNPYKNTLPYKFILLFRGSRDGFQDNIFHQKCDNKGATIFVAKIRNSNQLVGGYTPVDWDTSGQNKYSTDSFFFVLNNLNDLSNVQLRRISSSYASYAIYCHGNNGPNFGDSTLYIKGKNIYYSHNGYYPSISFSNGLQIEDYEVFQ
ncbi:10670_t:CDS:2, partial [Racocetra persica]